MLAVSRSACRATGSRSGPARPLSPGQWTGDAHGDSSTVPVVTSSPPLFRAATINSTRAPEPWARHTTAVDLAAVHGGPTPWTRAATSPPLVGGSAGNSLLAVDRRTKRNPESRDTRSISSCLGGDDERGRDLWGAQTPGTD